jgi:hypothetical protein
MHSQPPSCHGHSTFSPSPQSLSNHRSIGTVSSMGNIPELVFMTGPVLGNLSESVLLFELGMMNIMNHGLQKMIMIT